MQGEHAREIKCTLVEEEGLGARARRGNVLDPGKRFFVDRPLDLRPRPTREPPSLNLSNLYESVIFHILPESLHRAFRASITNDNRLTRFVNTARDINLTQPAPITRSIHVTEYLRL